MTTPAISRTITNVQTSRASVVRAMLDGVERDVIVAHSIGGVHGVLGTLNARTRFRVTALCPLAPGRVTPVSVYDRDNPRGQLDASRREVCSVARMICDDFEAARIGGDGTPAAPASRLGTDAFASRAGALVFTTTGDVWGVLLHYDLRLRTTTPKERLILDHLGRRFAMLFPRDVAAHS